MTAGLALAFRAQQVLARYLPTADMETSVLGPGLKVLVVDDNRDAADVLSLALAMAHRMDARTAYDGLHALELAQEFDPDVAILDLNMPLIDGYAAARALSERRPQPLLIALSGNATETARTSAAASGFNAYLLKPVDLNRLAAVIERGLTGSERIAAKRSNFQSRSSDE